jgi:hypothetical protein
MLASKTAAKALAGKKVVSFSDVALNTATSNSKKRNLTGILQPQDDQKDPLSFLHAFGQLNSPHKNYLGTLKLITCPPHLVLHQGVRSSQAPSAWS